MKKLFVSVLAVAAAVACNNAEIVSENLEAIEFGGPFVENATRAEDPSYGGAQGQKALTSFNLWGTVDASNGTPVAIYANDTVEGTVGSTDGTPNVWNCTSKTQYWIKDALYNFAALVNAGNVTLGSDLLPATVEFTSNGSTDLMYARSQSDIVGQTSGNNDPVNFNFSHLLSKVYIGVTNNSSTATGYSFLVKNINISAPKTGKYYIQEVVENEETKAAGTWTATNGDYNFENISVTGATAECDAEQLLIPGAATISFTVDIIYNNNKTITTVNYSKSVELEAATAYRFNIITSVGDPIQFSVEQQPTWTNANPSDLN